MIERVEARLLHPENFACRYGIPARLVILRRLFAGRQISNIRRARPSLSHSGVPPFVRVEQQYSMLAAALRGYFIAGKLEGGLTDLGTPERVGECLSIPEDVRPPTTRSPGRAWTTFRRASHLSFATRM